MLADDPRHGSNAGHLAHIFAGKAPCDPCREAHNEARRALWRKKYVRRVDRLYIDSTGTVRRIRALQALGWRYRDIDDAAGYGSRNWAHNLTTQPRVHLDTAEKVQAVYDRLCMTLGPSDRTRNRAMRSGWAPPLAWDEGTIDDPAAQPRGDVTPVPRRLDDYDQGVVDDILAGDYHLDATPAERTEVCRRWHRGGRSLAELGRFTGWRVDRYFRISDQTASAA